MRILLIEDELDMALVIKTALNANDIVVDHAATLELAREALLEDLHDAVLLDRKLPDGDGMTVIPYIRQTRPGLPVIVLSALGALSDRIAGLDTGADDYLAKPFSTDELLARLRAIMRRPNAEVGDNVIKIAGLHFSLTRRVAEVNGVALELPRKELLVLEALIRRSGRLFPRSLLLEAVYAYDEEIASNAIEAHVSRLRKKLEPAGVLIHSIRGLGYLLKSET